MRSQLSSIILVLLAILLAGCSVGDASTPGLLPPAATAAGDQPEGTAAVTQADPAAEPLSPEEPADGESAGEVSAAATGAGGSPAAVGATQASNPQSPAVTGEPGPAPATVPVLRQLTSGGCCVQPSWSADGSQVLFIDRPSPEAPSGLWGVAVQGGEPQFITDRLGIYSPDMQLRATLVNGTTVVERVATGEQWTIPNDGRAVGFSPDERQVAWTAGQAGPPFDTAQRQVWVSSFDGSQARQVFSSIGGGFAAWFPDGRLLVSGRVEGTDTQQAYWAFSLEEGQDQPGLVELARGERLREAQVSRDGNWLAYMVTFSQDPAQDGLWLVDTQGGEGRQLEVFGSYQWRDGGRLLVVPLDLSQPFHRLLQVQASTGEVQPLTDPAATPFKIANGDWSVSPDGSSIAFRSAQDGNIWVLELPAQP